MEVIFFMVVVMFIIITSIAISIFVVAALKFRKTADPKMYSQEVFNDLFFLNENKVGKVVQFFCNAPSLQVAISSMSPIECDIKEVNNYIFKMLDNDSENFFGLDDGETVLQFSNDGKTDEIIADIPVPLKGGSYQAVLHGIYAVEELVEVFFEEGNLYAHADFELVKY